MPKMKLWREGTMKEGRGGDHASSPSPPSNFKRPRSFRVRACNFSAKPIVCEGDQLSLGASIYDVCKIFGILDPFPTCLHLGLIYSTKFTQPPVSSFGLTPHPPQCGRHIWMSPYEREAVSRGSCYSIRTEGAPTHRLKRSHLPTLHSP